MATALKGLFNEYQLVFQVPGTYTAKDPVTGNVVPGSPTPTTVFCWLRVSKDPSIQLAVKTTLAKLGQDMHALTMSGRLVDPTVLPAGVMAGMTCPLEVNGEQGTFHLSAILPALVAEVEAELGQKIAGVWVSH